MGKLTHSSDVRWNSGSLNEPSLGGDGNERVMAEARAEVTKAMSDVRGWFIYGKGYIMMWLDDYNTVVWKISSEGDNRYPWWKPGHSMAPSMRMKSRRGGSMTRDEARSSKAREVEWGSLEYGCIIEEEKPEEHSSFDWKTFYQKETPGEVEAAITELESELMMSVQLENGLRVPMDLMWINRTLLARAL